MPPGSSRPLRPRRRLPAEEERPRFRGSVRRLCISLLTASLFLWAGAADEASALTYDANGVAISELRVTPSGSTARASFTVNTNRTRSFPRLVLRVRDEAGRNYDFVHRDGVTIASSQSFSGSRSGLPDGTYRARVAYSVDGSTWVRTTPVETFTVGPHNADGVGLKDLDLSVSGSTLTARYTLDTTKPVSFRPVAVAVRDSSGRNLDFGHRSEVVDGTQTFTASKDLSPGTYRAWIAYTLDGRNWVKLGTTSTFTVEATTEPEPTPEPTPAPEPTPEPSSTPQPPAGGPWTLAFNDEFNDTSLDTSKWDWKYPRSGDMVYSNWNNGEAQWYKRENISEGGGNLSLSAKRESTTSPYSGRTFDYTSGLIQSKPAFNFQYGYMEARMKLPKGSGFWPAFWTWPSNEQWPPEIDAMEFYGDNTSLIYQTYHGPNGADGTRVTNTDWTTDWHTFAVDWQPGKLTWYVDGVATKTLNEAPTLNMYLIANLAVANGARAPAPNSSTPFPSSLEIDYMRVWKR